MQKSILLHLLRWYVIVRAERKGNPTNSYSFFISLMFLYTIYSCTEPAAFLLLTLDSSLTAPNMETRPETVTQPLGPRWMRYVYKAIWSLARTLWDSTSRYLSLLLGCQLMFTLCQIRKSTAVLGHAMEHLLAKMSSRRLFKLLAAMLLSQLVNQVLFCLYLGAFRNN